MNLLLAISFLGSAAEQAHLKANDRIITIDGKKITTWDEIRPSLQGTANHGVTVVVEGMDNLLKLQ